MVSENELLVLCEYLIATGQRKGASAVEVLARSVDEMEANIEMGEISSVNRKVGDEIAIRLYVGKRMGSAFTNIPTRVAASEAVDMALSSARATTEDKDWLALPEPSEYNEIEGLWNESVAACESAKVVEIAAEIMSMATEAEAGLIPGFGGSGVSSYYSAYANSSGIAHSEKGTVAFASLGAIARIESGVTPLIFSYDIRRSLDLDLDRAVEDVANTIRVCKRTEKGSSGEHTVVMHPSAYGQLIYYTLGQAVRGDNVARGKSKLADKIGETVAPEVVTIVDDGTAPLGTNTSIADDEGVPHQRTPIIEKGVLRSFLFDTYWANRTGEKSTGNARRNTRRGLVELAPTNTVVEPGRREIGEIIAGIEHGYLIRNVQGAHSSNPESGDFSVVGNPAILIQDGEMVGAIHGLMVAGNIYDLFKNAEEVAKTPLVQLGLIGPEIVFEDVNIITREG